MQPVIISDTSCLILLDKIGELHLLQKLFKTIYTTQAVADEFGSNLPDWIFIKNPRDQTNQRVLETAVDKGEASAIALALEQKDCLLIIDELKGRRLARQLGLTITGTLGVLAEAKRAGHIPLLKPVLDKVKQTDFRLSEQLEAAVLSLAGE
jgi:predicted nucleic acid-binding protein